MLSEPLDAVITSVATTGGHIVAVRNEASSTVSIAAANGGGLALRDEAAAGG